MKLKLGFAASGLALLVGLSGCANQDDDIVPAKRPGFRPPSSPLVQDDLPPVDPLGGVPGGDGAENAAPAPYTPSGGGGGFQGGSSAVVSNPPQQAPAPQQEPAPQPQAPPADKPAKAAPPEYAKRVPGKPNWIRSPYDGKILDATGHLPGTEVRDPQSGKIMIVP